jgi:diadenosine tetraphosphate (Ap4A) HIT family hydrolase
MSDINCPFCNIDALKNRIIYETGRLFVTLSNPRIMPGHTLVVPKKHVGAPFLLDPCEEIDLLTTATRFQRKLMELFSQKWGKPAGCNLEILPKPFMPQTELAIPGHTHVHLKPRFWQDPYWQAVGRHEDKVFRKPSPEELDEFVALLSE